jgi:hypothetical protein
MKKYHVIIKIVILIILFSCGKFDLERNNPGDKNSPSPTPKIRTLIQGSSPVFGVSSLLIQGELVGFGGGTSVSDYGFIYWGKNDDPSVKTIKKSYGSKSTLGAFTYSVPNVTGSIYYQAYATNKYGTAIGMVRPATYKQN